MHYLITGHTGFKGSWLTLMLKELGHTVSGISLEPDTKSLFNQANITDLLENDFRIDILDKVIIKEKIEKTNPDVLIHLAAQSLVGESYLDPIKTFNTNIFGTINILDICSNLENIKAILIITSDKVYETNHSNIFLNENYPLGANDPYSSSKAAADIVTQSWIKSFGKTKIAIARAGNVIGGGDWSVGRLVPDIVDSIENQGFIKLRYPHAIRPWQHVLDCLNGYLQLVEKQIYNGISGEWNFGPDEKFVYSVEQFVAKFSTRWGISNKIWELDNSKINYENPTLLLDSRKAREHLKWKEFLSFENSIDLCIEWYKNYKLEDPRDLTIKQINAFFKHTGL